MLESRSGQGVEFLAQNTERFLEAARQRPEFALLATTFIPTVRKSLPKWIATSAEARCGCAFGLQTLRPSWRLFVNYFNRFGRVWQVYVQRGRIWRPSRKRRPVPRPQR